MSSYAFAKLYSKSCCTIDFISFLKKTYKFYNATLIVNIFQFIVTSILHYCSLHRNAQYGLVPFRVLKLKIEDTRGNYSILSLFGKLSFLKLSRDLSWHIFHICPLILPFSLLWSLYRLVF